MKLTHALRVINNQALDTLRKSIKLTIAEAPQHLNKVKEEKKRIMYEKFVKLNNWYTKIIGLDEVRMYQDRVTSLQEQLLQTQEKRREVGKQLADIRQKSLELQDQIHKIKRQDDFEKFLDLMKQETEVVKYKLNYSGNFEAGKLHLSNIPGLRPDRERLFTAFSNAIRDSHEKQRAQIEYTKYFGLILSITGSFLAFMYTTIKKQDLKQYIEQKLDNSNTEIVGLAPVVLDMVKVNEQVMKEVAQQRVTLNDVVRMLNSDGRTNLTPLPVNNIDEYRVDLLKYLGAFCIAFVLAKMISG
ncbi:hypothetical protein NQ314_017375 [Rhamnusium bicolor]|uniref:Coiled-coil domain-containing protein 51 n=1 Tax=Rhamnusium bicolor TaxID=1586634 RepID=A0AAV8WW79_9CUCU|nr:hypothetical protein NQ314_017375 [Rhamnusium bicolor]